MIKLRKATYDDCNILFEWANDPSVRANSFNTKAIEIDDHRTWLKKKLTDKNTDLFIVTYNNDNVGTIRLDKDADESIISYSIDKNYRGRGIGTKVLDVIKKEMQELTLVGFVKKENIPSIKAFEKAGYIRFDEENQIKFISK
nr:GNAT family N-acetyltransferase [uncultured Romboutsia sp.]